MPGELQAKGRRGAKLPSAVRDAGGLFVFCLKPFCFSKKIPLYLLTIAHGHRKSEFRAHSGSTAWVIHADVWIGPPGSLPDLQYGHRCCHGNLAQSSGFPS